MPTDYFIVFVVKQMVLMDFKVTVRFAIISIVAIIAKTDYHRYILHLRCYSVRLSSKVVVNNLIKLI